MKSSSIDRVLPRLFLAAALGVGLVGATGCPGPSSKPAIEQAPTGGDSLLTADGKHFAASRTYQGECMPAGSRGGCYSVTLHADGTYRHMLLDAAMMGTYVIDGDQVTLTPDNDTDVQTMTLSPDRSHLGDFVYQASAE